MNKIMLKDTTLGMGLKNAVPKPYSGIIKRIR